MSAAVVSVSVCWCCWGRCCPAAPSAFVAAAPPVASASVATVAGFLIVVIVGCFEVTASVKPCSH